ncbi:hypothetical protein EVA_16019 [gut metagenome]|uniref:Uncharacterized protein n=1 Tax=gut metagenome TaxID=749906 RepID=J9FLS8_9ZZZZ
MALNDTLDILSANGANTIFVNASAIAITEPAAGSTIATWGA